jgi:hypothetical protein
MSLTEKQLQAINDLFETGGDETIVCQKHKIPRSRWRKWLVRRDFIDELAARMDALKRQSNIILTNHLPLAAKKLVSLCENENHQTALKATLDILSSQTGKSEILNLKSLSSEVLTKEDQISDTAPPTIDPTLASKLLAALAEENSKL